ncbi:MAG: M16 family metallopeptidase [Thermodesulfobacteriota bacterium]
MFLRHFFITIGMFCMLVGSNLGTAFEARAEELVLLENGLQVLIQEDDRFPLVSMRLYVHAGSAYEKPREAGISHLLEHMVFKGTERRGPGEIASEVESAGGSLNAGTSFDYTMYKIDLPRDEWKLGVDVLKDMIFGSVFDPAELKSEKSVVLAELERGEDNPGQLLFKSLQGNVWKGMPYSRPIIGYADTVKEISSQDLKDYIDRLYQPQSMLLVVCGDVQKEEVLKQVRSQFGDLRNTHPVMPPQPLDVDGKQEKPRIDVRTGPWKKAYLGIAFPIPALSSPRACDIELLSYMLGGDMTSRLYRKFKYEKQLVDQISCSAVMLERAGMLYMHVVLPPDSVDQFWKEFSAEAADLTAEAFDSQILHRAKMNIEDDLFSTKETLGGLASKLGYFQFFEHSTRAGDKYISELHKVDEKMIQESIDLYLRPERLNAMILLPDSVSVEQDAFKDMLLSNWPLREGREQDEREKKYKGKDREILDLGQGQTLVILEDQSLPYTALNVSWPGGDEMLTEKDAGLAELTARSLIRGTTNMTATEIQDFLASRAADLDAASSRDKFSLQARFPVRYSGDMYDLVREMLFSPAFSAMEVQKAINDQRSEIASRDDQPLGFMFRRIFPFLFSKGPLSNFHLGRDSALQSMTAGEVRDFWERQFARPCVITVCGQIERDPLNSLVRELSHREVGADFKSEDNLWSAEHDKAFSLEDRNQAHVMLVFPVPGLRDESLPALKILKTVLAGQGGILFRELRDEKGLGYTVTSFLWQSPKQGFLAFYIGTYPEKEKEAISGFKEIAARMQEELLDEKYIKRAVNMISANYYRGHQTLASRSNEAANLITRGFDLDFNRKIIEEVRDMSAEDIRKVARKYLDMDKSYLMVVRP